MKRGLALLMAVLPACAPVAGDPSVLPPVSDVEPEVVATAALEPETDVAERKPVLFARFRMTGQQESRTGGLGRDYSWGRIGSASTEGGAKAILEHARLGGLRVAEGAPAPEPQAATPVFTVESNQQINVSPALYTVNGITSDPGDRMIVYTRNTTTNQFVLQALKNIDTTTPTAQWELNLDTRVNGSAIAADINGTSFYAVSAGNTTGDRKSVV